MPAARRVAAVQMQWEIRICHTEEFDAEDAEKPFKLTGMACALPGVLVLVDALSRSGGVNGACLAAALQAKPLCAVCCMACCLV